MGVGEDDGYERKEFWSDSSYSIFFFKSSEVLDGAVWGPVNEKRRFKLYLSTNYELYNNND